MSIFQNNLYINLDDGNHIRIIRSYGNAIKNTQCLIYSIKIGN